MKIQLDSKIIEKWNPLIFFYFRTVDEKKINLVACFCEWHYNINQDFGNLSRRLLEIKDKIENIDYSNLDELVFIFDKDFIKAIAGDEWRNNQINKLWQS